MQVKQDTSGLDETLNIIKKAFGSDAITMGRDSRGDIQTLRTGSVSLDLALGTLGYPRGRIIEIYGHESSGKTTLALMAIAEMQKAGGTVVFIDAEHTLDLAYAAKLGCNTSDLILCQPGYGEQALRIIEIFLQQASADLIVVDSLAALIPKAELDSSTGPAQLGGQARMITNGLRKIVAHPNKRNCTLLFINQMRAQITTGFGSYGQTPQDVPTPGGWALKHFTSVRVAVRKGISLKVGEKIVGHVIKMKIVKNKLAAPGLVADYYLHYYDIGNVALDIVAAAIEHDIIEKRGSWLTYGDIKHQGKSAFAKELQSLPVILEELYQSIIASAISKSNTE